MLLARRLAAVALVLLLGLPAVPASAHDMGVNVNVWVNQESVFPGQDLGVTVQEYGTGPSVPVQVRLVPIDGWTNWQSAPATGPVREQGASLPADLSDWSTSQVVFTTLGAGIYRVESVTGADEPVPRALVQVTDLGLVTMRAGPQVLVWAVQLSSGQPVPGAVVAAVDNATVRGVTDNDGVTMLPRVPAGATLVASSVLGSALAQSDSSYGFVRLGDGSEGEGRIYVHTDRPLYRPGQTVHVKVVSWHPGADGLVPLPGETVTLGVTVARNGRQERVASVPMVMDGYGSGRADIALPANAALGSYSMTANGRGATGYGGFEVQEYRLPGFKVTLTPTASTVVAGSEVQLLVAAERFNGAALDKGKVHYEVDSLDAQAWGCTWCDYDVAKVSGDGVADVGAPAYDPGTPTHQSGDLELRSDGTALLRLRGDRPGSLNVRVSVLAANGERIDASTPIQVESADIRLSIETPTQGVEVGSTTPITLHLTDLAGRPRDGTIAVDVRRYDSGNATHHDVPVKGGKGTFDLLAAEPGSYVVEARIADASGRVAQATAWLWAAGEGDGFGGDGLQLRAERATATPTGELRFHASTGAAQGRALIVATSGGFLGHRLLTGAGTLTVSAAAARDREVTGLAVQVVPPTAPGLYPDLRQARDTIQLDPHPRGLQVDIQTDRTTYENGATARILVQVHDAQGRPVRAQVGIAIVDQALLALRSQSSDPLSVLTMATGTPYPQTSWNQYSPYLDWNGDGFMFQGARGVAMAPKAPMDAVTLAFDEATNLSTQAPVGVEVRSYFPETALWLPQLETDAQGVLRLQVALPDSLTGWDIEAQALTGNGQAGTGSATFSTLRRLEADLFAPRFLVAGDRSTLQATVFNHLGEQRDVQVLLKADGLQLDGPATRTLSLAPGASGLVSFPVSATHMGLANVTFYAWTDGEPSAGDAMQRTFPVKAHGTPSSASRAGRGEADLTVTLPATAAEGKGALEVTVTPTVANAMVDALPFLTGYPYGCVEQTLSRFLPDVAVARAADRLHLRDRIDSDLDAQVDAGLKRLYGFQHASGAWGWWTDDADNEYTTAYTVYGLAVAKQAGYDVDAGVLADGVRALHKMALVSTGALHAYHIYALAVAGDNELPIPDATEPAELSMSILAAHQRGDDAWGEARIARLVATGVRGGAASDDLHWPDPVDGWTSHGMSSDVMVTALALRALSAIAPNGPDAGDAVRWLLSNREGGNWESTKDTAEAIFALVDYLEAVGNGPAAGGATVTVDGVSRHVAFSVESSWTPQAPLSFPVGVGDHHVRIVPDGRGPLYWSTRLAYSDGGEPITADEGSFTFERRVLNRTGQPVTHLDVGEEATVEVTVLAKRDAHYLQVEDPLPAGLEAIAEQAGVPIYLMDCFECGGYRPYYGWSNAELHDDRAAFFAADLLAGTSATYRYTVRAVFPGCYHVLPTMAVGMYDAGLAGHGDETRFCVDGPVRVEVGRIGVTEGPGGRVATINVHAVDAPSSDLTEVPGDKTGQTTAEETVAPAKEEPPVRIIVRNDDGDPVDEPIELPIEATPLEPGGGIVHVQVPVPDGDFSIEVEVGNTRQVIRHVEATAPAQDTPGFNADGERIWGEGVAQMATSPLHPAGEPDFAALFAGVPLDPLTPGVAGPAQVPLPGGLALLAIALALLVGAAWRRR